MFQEVFLLVLVFVVVVLAFSILSTINLRISLLKISSFVKSKQYIPFSASFIVEDISHFVKSAFTIDVALHRISTNK